MSTWISEDWECFAKATAEANRLNKASVFDGLSQAGITQVRVGFDGEGDQGQMQRAEAQCNGNTVAFPEMTVSLRDAAYGSVLKMNLQEAVGYLCYSYLEEGHGGWEINEGSFGEFTFDVATRTITLDFHGRLVDTDYRNHTY